MAVVQRDLPRSPSFRCSGGKSGEGGSGSGGGGGWDNKNLTFLVMGNVGAGFSGVRRGLTSLDEGRLWKRGEGVRSHAESPILLVRVEFILWCEGGA